LLKTKSKNKLNLVPSSQLNLIINLLPNKYFFGKVNLYLFFANLSPMRVLFG